MRLAHPFPATRRLTYILTVLLALHVVLAWITLQAAFVFIELVWRTLVGREELGPLLAMHVSQFQVLRLGHAVLWLLTGAVFFQWVDRAHGNLSALGATGLTHRRGRTARVLPVPVRALARVPSLMRELWNASDPRLPVGPAWRGRSSPARVRWWWGLMVAAAGAELGARALAFRAGGPLDLGPAMQVLVVGQLATVAAAVTGMAVVQGLDARQQDAAWRRGCGGA